MDYFVRIFKDPPNVETLLACVQPPPVSLQDYMHIKMSAPAFRPEDRLHLSALRMGDDSSQERAFVAALYLKDRLSMDDKDIEVWCKNAHINRLGNIAREIMYAEPMLQGFSLAILLEHHQCIIKHYRDLEEGLQAGAYPDWVPTHFSNIARDLSILEENNGLIQSRLKNMEAYRLVKESRNAKVLQRMEYRMKAEQQRQFAKFNGAISTVTHTWTKDEEDRITLSTPPAQTETVADASIKAEDQHSNSSPTLQLPNVSPVHSSRPASGSHQLPGMEFFVNIFKDPPNVDELLASVRPPPTSVKVYKQTHLSRPIEIEDGQLILSDFQIGNDAPREKAFLAALYLKNRLSLREEQQQAWCIGRTSRLHQITNEILNTEPRLRGFASYALLEHHICVIKLYQDLEKGLQAGAYPDWVPTHFSNIARELSILENNSGLLRLRLKYREDQIQSKEKWKEKRLKRMFYQTEQMEQPRQLAKARIDEVMITIAIAMFRNDQGVPIMVPAFDEDRRELFMTELEYENEDADDNEEEEEEENKEQVPIATQSASIETEDAGKVFKAEEASWMDRWYTPSSPHEPSQAPVPGVMNWPQPTSQIFSTPQTQSSYYASSPSRRRGIEYFVNIFKDPPNVDELLASIRPPLTSAQVLTNIERSMSNGQGDMINLLSLQAENNPTREKAFLTTLYLRNRLSFGEEEELSIGYNPLYNHLKGIMREIRTTEPKLRSVSVHDLMTYHQSVITIYRAFEEELQVRYYNWTPTHFSNLLRGLRITEDKWRVHNEEWKEVEEKERQTEQTEQAKQTSYSSQTSARSPSLGAAWHERWMRDNGGSKEDGGWDKNDASRLARLARQTLRPENLLGPSDIQMGDDFTQETAFLAALYVRSRLDLRVKEPYNPHWRPARTPSKCNQNYRNLEGLQAGVYSDWVPTHFSRIAGDLFNLEVNNGFIQLRLKSLQRWRLTKQLKEVKRLEALMDEGDGLSMTTPGQFGHQGGLGMTQAFENSEEDEENEEDEEGEVLTATQLAPARDWVQSLHAVLGPHQRPRMEFFVDIFKDPPNADELLRHIRPPSTSRQGSSRTPSMAEAFGYNHRLSPSKRKAITQRNLSDLRMGDGPTQERAFDATMYLKNRLSLGNMKLESWCGGKLHDRLNRIAREIVYVEPILQGFTQGALVEHHRRVVMHYQDLEERLQAEAYPDWVPTQFSDIARELSTLEDNNPLIRLTLETKLINRQSKARREATKSKRSIYQMEQMEYPQQLAKAKIDNVLITIAFAMARNDHGVPMMVPALDWDQGEFFMTELEYEGEDKDVVRTTTHPARDVTNTFTKVEDASWMSRPHITASPNEPSPAPVPCVMNRPRQTLHVFSTP
ncbi:hypothetical protein BGX34_009483 [Mortierella sp. NVP85]|nr:hypothetical protein BGX34_009483 [Mortierella sp. NVP85]